MSLGSRILAPDDNEATDSSCELRHTPSGRLSKEFRTDMDRKRFYRMRSIVNADLFDNHLKQLSKLKDMNPYEAMYQLLEHVKLDPDGGILNLVNNTDQDSKVRALKKNTLEICLAIFAFVRCIANPVAMIFCSTHMLEEYFLQAGGKSHFRQEMSRITLNVPLEEAFIVANMLELIFAVVCILITIYHISMIVYHAASEKWRTSEYAALEQQAVSPKYMYVSRLASSDLPRLQNLSVLRVLQFAHPNLIAKHEKQFSSKDDLARPILEGFLGIDAHTLNDDQLSSEVAKVIIQNDMKDDPEAKKIDAAARYMDMSPSRALRELRRSNLVRTKESDLLTEGLQPDALKRAWRYDLLVCTEKTLFFTIVICCFALGATEFFHKVCRCAFMLTEPDVPLGTAIVFFTLFLNQTMGMMSVNQLLRRRLETFIFGGADAAMSSEEHYIMDTYMALLKQKVWQSSELSIVQKVALMFQFDDDDLQQLVVEESHFEKVRVSACVRSYMHKSGNQNHFVSSLSQWIRL